MDFKENQLNAALNYQMLYLEYLPRTASILQLTNSPSRYDSMIPIVTESYIIELSHQSNLLVQQV